MWVFYVSLKVRWDLWYHYFISSHSGGDSIHWKQLFSHSKRHDILHISVFFPNLVIGNYSLKYFKRRKLVFNIWFL